MLNLHKGRVKGHIAVRIEREEKSPRTQRDSLYWCAATTTASG